MKITNVKQLPKAAKTNGYHPAGDGTYLGVKGAWAAWVYRYTKVIDGTRKQVEVKLGDYPQVGLADATAAGRTLRHRIRSEGHDPRATPAPAAKTALTFAEAMETYITLEHRTWVPKHRAIWRNSMEQHIIPAIGGREAHTLTAEDVVAAVLPSWIAIPVTGLRLLQRTHAVLEQAIAADPTNFRHGNVADRAKRLLPRGLRKRPVPHPSFVWQDAPEFYGLLCGRPEIAAMALRFCMLTGTPRTAEVVAARWGEIEHRWGLDVWNVPGRRVKARELDKATKVRVIPLSTQATKLLAAIRPADAKPADFIFPCVGTGRMIKGKWIEFSGHMSEKQMQRLIREIMDLPWHTHGIRSAFTGWSATNAETPTEMMARKIALDHQAADDKTDAAYMRETLPAAHRALVERWGAFLTA